MMNKKIDKERIFRKRINDKRTVDEKIAREIFLEIKKSNHILLALHVSPDIDSVASVLTMNMVLEKMDKKTKMISFGQIPPRLFYLPGIEKIEYADFGKIDLKDFDLFVSLDCAAERMITRSQYLREFPPKFKIINIDHHITNTKFGDVNLIKYLSSTAEILYKLFQIWKIKINKDLAQLIFAGIFSDSGCFQYPLTSADTLRVAAELMDIGASLNYEVLQQFRSYNIKTLKYWERILENMQVDMSGKFIWSKLSCQEKKDLEIDAVDIQEAASLFAPIVFGTEFGIILVEETDGLTRGSLRSRDDFDVSKLAVELGGGGHKQAAGFSLEMPLEEAERKVLGVARKFLISK